MMLQEELLNEMIYKYHKEMTDASLQTDRLRFSFKKLQARSRRSDAETMTFLRKNRKVNIYLLFSYNLKNYNFIR